MKFIYSRALDEHGIVGMRFMTVAQHVRGRATSLQEAHEREEAHNKPAAAAAATPEDPSNLDGLELYPREP